MDKAGSCLCILAQLAIIKIKSDEASKRVSEAGIGS